MEKNHSNTEKKIKHPILVCYHYSICPGPIGCIPAVVTLTKIAEDRYMCTVCRKEFSKAYMIKMNMLLAQAYNNQSSIRSVIGFTMMRLFIKPVKYYKLASGRVRYVDG